MSFESADGWAALFEDPTPTSPAHTTRVPLAFWKEYCNAGFQEIQGWVVRDKDGNFLNQAMPASTLPGFIGYVKITETPQQMIQKPY